MARYKQNWIFILIFFSVFGLLFYIYEVETYTYLCESESNAPACYLLSKKFESSGEASKSDRYMHVACDKKYDRACEIIKNEIKK